MVAEAAAKKPAHGPPVEEVEIVLAGQRRELAAAPLSEARVGIRGEVATTRSTRSLLLVQTGARSRARSAFDPAGAPSFPAADGSPGESDPARYDVFREP